MKKFLRFGFVCLLLVGAFSLMVSAADLIVGSGSCMQGESITVDVTLADNPGFGGMEFSVSFDSDRLTLTEIRGGDLAAVFTVTPVEKANATGEIAFAYAGIANVDGDGRVATLVFTANSDRYGETALTLSIPAEAAFTYSGYTMLDLDLVPKSGSVLVRTETPAPGDMNGDGNITLADALLGLRMLLKGDAGDLSAMDLNGDGEFTLLDILRILKVSAAE